MEHQAPSSQDLAPIFPADVPASRMIPASYIVSLKPGYSISQHSKTIEVDIAPYIDRIYTAITEYVSFSVQGVDDSLLRAVRSDQGVAYVSRDLIMESLASDKTPRRRGRDNGNQIATQAALMRAVAHINSTVLAPLYQSQHYEQRQSLIPNEFTVRLRDDYSLDAHWFSIGSNLSNTAFFHHLKIINAYSIRLDDHIIHELIRKDQGVESIQQNIAFEDARKIPSRRPRKRYLPKIFQRVRRWIVWATGKAPWPVRMVTAGQKLQSMPDVGPAEITRDGGFGIHVYVVDSGVRISHELFRVFEKGTAVNFGGRGTDDLSPYVYEKMYDRTGHGTHVAGVVIQHANGATIVNVKVLGIGQSSTKVLNGEEIESAFKDADNDYELLDGTSQACAAVSGVMATMMSLEDFNFDVQKMQQRLLANVLHNAVTGVPPQQPNFLVQSGLQRQPNLPFLNAPQSLSANPAPTTTNLGAAPNLSNYPVPSGQN
ncbi:MAG: hypothetical protein Q9227_005473 [Pyrenula ochraceoflavens]